MEPSGKQSRAAKRREKRAVRCKQQEEALLKSAALAGESSRSKELRKLQEMLLCRDLIPYEVPSDGDCLYKSIAHQLVLRKISFHDLQLLSGLNPPLHEWALADPNNPNAMPRFLRFIASTYLMENISEFLPFMVSPETGDPMTYEEFSAYCGSVQQPSTWGGQIELRAMAHALRIPIEVVQADGPSILIGDEFNGPPLMVVYHRHAFALGEHYNSCVPVDNPPK